MRSLQTVAGLKVPARLRSFCCALAIACLACCGGTEPVRAAQASATTLSLTSGGSAVSSVAGGTVVTLTATVQAGATKLKLGQVNFCDATAASCTDIHLVGTAQLTSAGSAVLRFRPGPGSHSYKAVFLGTLAGAASSSAAVGLTVGPRPPGLQTTFTVASVAGPDATNMYALTANVGTKGAISPSGTVSFLDTNDANSLLGTATLVGGGNGFLNVPIPEQSGGADALPIVAIGDFNGDGIPDIASAPHGGIAISLGNGDGTFAAPLIPNVDSADGINAFGVGDFNGDGITDLLVDDEDTGKLTVLLGKGDGTFTVGQSMPFNTQSIAIADFNGDGKLDLALAGSAQTTILLGNGDGTFTAAPNQPQIGSSQVVAADFNGDGKLDLAVSPSNGATSTLLGNGDGTFTAAPDQLQIITDELVAADFNGDGKIDLAALDLMGDTVTIVLGNGDGTFSAALTFPTGLNAFSLAVGDFNGDGKPDIAVAGTANYPNRQVTIFAGNGDGTFTAGFAINDDLAESLAAADFTGDGSSDLATFGSVLLGNLTISTATNNIDLPAGFVVIQADYPGDASNAPSNSTNKPGILVPQPLFSLSSNPVTVAPGTSASGSFSVTSSGFTGTLNLSCVVPGRNDEDPSPLTCSVPPTVNFFSAGGTEDLTYTITAQANTPAGPYTAIITATNALGDAPPASTTARVLVGGQNYVLTNNGATIASPGASGSSTITISPTGGYTGQVTMSCAVSGGPSGAVNPPTCTIPSPISVTGSPVTTTLTLNTQPATSPGSYAVTVTGASAGGLSATTSFTVNVPANVPAAPPGFTLSSTGITVASPGPSVTSTITISPSGGFTGSVALSCAVTGGPTGGADAPTCSVTAPPAITGSAAVTATLTISTTAASAATHSAARTQYPRDAAAGGAFIAMASLLFFGFPIWRRRMITQLSLLPIATLMSAAIGCGGTRAAAPAANPGTTPGAYTVTVTGSSGAIKATTAVTVTVN
jgi:trimeric autotransporter adhesin